MPDDGDVEITYQKNTIEGFNLGLMQDFGLDTSDALDTELDDIIYINCNECGGIISGDNPRSVLLAGNLVDHLPYQHTEGYHHRRVVPGHQEKDFGQNGIRKKRITLTQNINKYEKNKVYSINFVRNIDFERMRKYE
jgi:hypothetical protein